MLSTLRHTSRVRAHTSLPSALHLARTAATAPASTQKRAGDISDAFASLSGKEFTPLEPRYATLKKNLIAGHEDAIRASWERLLKDLRTEIPHIVEQGSKIVPEVQYKDIVNGTVSHEFVDEHRKRGVAVVRGVVEEKEARGYKDEIEEYVRKNPHTKAFPADNPQVFELYWSRPQMRARTHPDLLNAQRYLMSFWHAADPNARISMQHPTAYADRLRIRHPGDARFALGPHVDGGSVERWEPDGYGRGGVYDKIFEGRWEEYDPWEAGSRLPVVSDMYQGVGACSMFRMFQGWLSMSETGPFEGTLLVNPLLSRATAYMLLRPFFTPTKGPTDPASDVFDPSFLDPRNWRLEQPQPSSWLQGATPGQGQELRAALHPHLDLARSMVHVPRVRPGDYVSWHCDGIHAVDSRHAGAADSSVLYIPACPLTEANAAYLARQRDCWTRGVPSPDFGGGEGESRHVGRPSAEQVAEMAGREGRRAWGLEAWDSTVEGLLPGQRAVLDRANEVLGFHV
ncbi:uncharacterized protein BKCO1_1500088 [Diplodia corticola]|uniref:Duf1479 domain protein n=1 Tax=Diplodia corticola TaxID=236234 RepID=A0A1J9R571_9PEZI|nr:uncharacterized protein BKCO1_1500088 [Diplodia corticola]OJD35697.1 hypothetical protein BKCO1_1500088 [Diplodia corticola]